ncbi:hypothetical protein FACS189473_3190 [Spirochaetia bacterium]|nr:hypothetical protein FACS189473_3190 [Spirochaetia bacterium]
MKRYVVFFVLAVCLTGALFAQTEDDFDYMQNASGKITITKYLGKDIKDVVIPSKIQGIEVTEIDVGAFAETFDSVAIPSTVITIKDNAFRGCGLKLLTIPNSVTSIGRYAFADNKLTEVILPNSVTEIGAYCFENNNITKITFSNKMKEIPTGAFMNNKLSQVIIPEGITTLTGGDGPNRKGPFESNKLVYIKLPNSITTIKSTYTSSYGRVYVNSGIFAGNPITIIDCPKDILGKLEVGRIDEDYLSNETLNIVALKIGANFQQLSAYEESFRNFYTVQGKKAGIYLKQGRLWRVGTQAEFDKLINDKIAEQEAQEAEQAAKQEAQVKFEQHQSNGKELLRSRKYQEAIVEFLHAIEIKPEDWNVYDNIGYCYEMSSDDLVKAEEYYAKAKGFKPTDLNSRMGFFVDYENRKRAAELQQKEEAERQQEIAEAQQRMAEYQQRADEERQREREKQAEREKTFEMERKFASIVPLLAGRARFNAQEFQLFTSIYSEIRQLKIQYPDNRDISRMEQSITQLETKLNKNQKKALDSMP